MAVRSKSQVIPRFEIWLVLLVFIMSGRGQSVEFTKNPSDKVAVAGKGEVGFTCAVNSNGVSAEMRWFKDNDQELTSLGRLEIVRNSEDIDQSLVITNPELEDDGLYYCRYGNESSAKGRLQVLPSSWLPKCERFPGSGKVPVGEAYSISCTSTGHANTSLRWVLADSSALGDGVETKRDLTTSIRYNGTVSTSDSESLLFLCEATLDMQVSESCTVFINDEKPVDPIPFVVVGLMSLIAVLLFFVVLFILFRHRQCRFCREPMLEPHAVLDADALQTGAWIPPPVVAIDVSISEEEGSVNDSPHAVVYMNLQSSSQPPDVVPTQEINGSISETDQHRDPSSVSSQEAAPEAPNDLNVKTTPSDPVVLPDKTEDANKRKSKTKNHTLTKNMDQNFEKPAQTLEKKALPSRKSRHPGKREKKIKHYKEPPVKARMKTPKDPIYAQVKKLNVPSKSVPTVGGGGEEDTPSTSAGPGQKTTEPPTPPPRPSPSSEADNKETSSIATTETDSTDRSSQVVNDLGRGDSKKNRVRHYRKKSEGSRKNSDQDDAAVLNIPGTSRSDGSAKGVGKDKPPSDRIIYAELDFSKKVGLNIIE